MPERKRYYSASTKGFYDSVIHGENMPSDAVEVSDADYIAIFEAQAQGKLIAPNENGYPVAVAITYSLEETRLRKLAALAAYRYAKETGGITVSGSIIKTDRESQSLIAGAKIYSDLNPDVLIDWKAESGWVQINRAAILAISQAVAAHVQACFSREKVHSEAISALATKEEIESYDFFS
jgi:hypothetical protein